MSLNRTKYLLENEVAQLNTFLERVKDKYPRDVNLIWLLLNTGGRASEILNLTWADLNHTDKTIFIRANKNSNDREIPLPKWLFKRLVEMAPDCINSSDKLFPISYTRLRQIWQLYRPVPKKVHSLRHTFAIRLYSRTKDLRLVKTALGHKSINNTMIYADYVYSQEEMRKLLAV